MAKYVLKRVLMALFTIFLVATLTFFLMKAVPGNPFVSEKTPPQSVLDALNEKYGLDQPLSVQYFKYMSNLLRGYLGVSVKMQKNYPVISIIKEMPRSARLPSSGRCWWASRWDVWRPITGAPPRTARCGWSVPWVSPCPPSWWRACC